MKHQQRQTDDLQGPEEAGQAPGRVGLVKEARWGVEERAKCERPQDYRTTDHGTTGCGNRHLTLALSPSEAERGCTLREKVGDGKWEMGFCPLPSALCPLASGSSPSPEEIEAQERHRPAVIVLLIRRPLGAKVINKNSPITTENTKWEEQTIALGESRRILPTPARLRCSCSQDAGHLPLTLYSSTKRVTGVTSPRVEGKI